MKENHFHKICPSKDIKENEHEGRGMCDPSGALDAGSPPLFGHAAIVIGAGSRAHCSQCPVSDRNHVDHVAFDEKWFG